DRPARRPVAVGPPPKSLTSKLSRARGSQVKSLRGMLVAGALLGAGLCACQDPCDAPGAICTWAGTADAEFNGHGKPRRQSGLYWPVDMGFAPDNTPYVMDWNNHRVRRVTAQRTLQTVIGNDNIGDGPSDSADKLSTGALGTDVNLNHPTQL